MDNGWCGAVPVFDDTHDKEQWAKFCSLTTDSEPTSPPVYGNLDEEGPPEDVLPLGWQGAGWHYPWQYDGGYGETGYMGYYLQAHFGDLVERIDVGDEEDPEGMGMIEVP